jgi:hypothetical protein
VLVYRAVTLIELCASVTNIKPIKFPLLGMHKIYGKVELYTETRRHRVQFVTEDAALHTKRNDTNSGEAFKREGGDISRHALTRRSFRKVFV